MPSSTTFATLLRREDARLLTGGGQFVGNVTAADALFAVFVRSHYARAVIQSVDTAVARRLEGVVAVLSAQDFAGAPRPQVNTDLSPIHVADGDLMTQAVNFVGQPVALVLARSLASAQAGADAVMVDYAALDAELDFAAGAKLAQLSNTQGTLPATSPTTQVSVHLPRVAASPLEPRAALMLWNEAEQQLTAHLSTQTPSRARNELAAALNIKPEQVRVIATDVGGAFGGKASLFFEDILLALAARQLQCGLRWQAARGEDLLSATHGRGANLSAQIWANDSGQLQALQAEVHFTLGAWLTYSAVVPLRNAVRILPGPYRMANLAVQGAARASNAAAVGIYRGAGRPEATILMERVVDAAAAKLGLDPLAMRLANVWQPTDLPRALSNMAVQDSADFPALLQRCAALFGYAGKRQNQTHLHGIGIALYTEPCGAGGESVRITAQADGTFLLATGATAQGQGRETAYAAIAAQALGCAAEKIHVTHGDTAANPAGVGALASRSTAIGGSAILQAAAQLQAERAAGAALPHTVTVFHTVAHEAWASGCVMVAVSVCADTGQLTVNELAWVDDAGVVIHPELVHGQLLGGMAQGLGQALMERVVYDEYGQLITGSLMDYALPRATDMPAKVQIESLPTRSAANTLGAKGVGEAGCIGVPAAILNAAYDALRHLPDVQLDFPLTAQQLWRVLESAK